MVSAGWTSWGWCWLCRVGTIEVKCRKSMTEPAEKEAMVKQVWLHQETVTEDSTSGVFWDRSSTMTCYMCGYSVDHWEWWACFDVHSDDMDVGESHSNIIYYWIKICKNIKPFLYIHLPNLCLGDHQKRKVRWCHQVVRVRFVHQPNHQSWYKDYEEIRNTQSHMITIYQTANQHWAVSHTRKST